MNEIGMIKTPGKIPINKLPTAYLPIDLLPSVPLPLVKAKEADR
jgi:hypothetical protein